jgi:hypothetical protein
VDGNLAVRTHTEYQRANAARDWNAVQATFAPTMRVDDRRAMFGGMLNQEESLASAKVIIDSGGSLTFEVLATRGDRLVLDRWRWALDDSEVFVVIVAEVDADGLLVQETWFDPDDLGAAYKELDRLADASAK